MNKIFTAFAAALVMGVVGSAHAALVTYTATVDDVAGTFEIVASASLDNDGLSGWAMNIFGITAATNVSPLAQVAAPAFAPKGFGFGRTAALAGDGNIGGAQDPTVIAGNPGQALLGVGQVGGDLDTLAGGLFPAPDGIYGAPVLLVTGTLEPGTASAFRIDGASASVFGAQTTTQVAAEVEVIIVPEPASLALLGLGGLAMIRRR
jgi:hypothetical protein